MEEAKRLLRLEDIESESDVDEPRSSAGIGRRRMLYQVLLHLFLVLSIAVNIFQALHLSSFVERRTICETGPISKFFFLSSDTLQFLS